MELLINKIIQGDSLDVLKTLKSESVDCIITSPPYFGLRSYLKKDDPLKAREIGSEKSMEEHIQILLEIFSEVKRVMKTGGNFWLNYGDCYASNGKIGGDFSDNGKISKAHSGPARVKDFQEKSLMMLPERIALRMLDDGWILRDRIAWAKQVYFHKDRMTKGSAMPSSVKDRFNNTWEYLFHFTKNKKYFFDLDAVRIPTTVCGVTDFRDSAGQPNRLRPKRNANAFSYRVRDAVRKTGQPQFKASEKEILNYGKDINTDPRGNTARGPGSWRGALHKTERKYVAPVGPKMGKDGDRQEWSSRTPNYINEAGKNIPNVWLIGTEPSRELHFARFSSELCTIPILASCPKGGIVMDIFAGSGTALWKAKELGRNYLGIELNQDYITIAEKRLAGTTGSLFTGYTQNQK